MRATRLGFLVSIVGWIVCVALVSRSHAQVTTASLRGTVTYEGLPVAGAGITLIHVPSGNVKTSTTEADGSFVFSGLRVGGPYQVTAVVSGFQQARVNDVYLSAGKTTFRSR
jgi:hypothetical protein